MTDPILKPISGMDPAATLTGDELVPLVQGGVNVRATAQEIANLADVPGGGGGGVNGMRPPAASSLLTGSLWALPQSVAGVALATAAIPNGWSVYAPFVVDRQITISDVALMVTSAIGSATANIAIYSSDPTTLFPIARIGTAVSISVASTGVQSAAYSATLVAGLYYFAVESTSNATIRTVPGAVPIAYNESGTPFQVIRHGGASLPATPLTVSLDANAPAAVFVRFTEG